MFNQNGTLSGLATYTVAPGAAGPYVVDGKITLPKIVDGDTAASQVVAVIKVNAATKYTGPAGADGFHADVVTAAATDTISVTLSSAAAVDQPLNTIKATIAISSGV